MVVGIDWASQSHQVCLVDAHGECLGERAVAHGGAGIEELCDWLIARTGATPEVIGVAIEMTQGPVVEALLERGFCVYGINPKQPDRFRDRFTVAGAKDGFWMGFTEDIVVRVAEAGSGSRIDVRSASRHGRSDLGVNAARIRTYLAALHEAETPGN